jgi:effector-binding domain-containing protein
MKKIYLLISVALLLLIIIFIPISTTENIYIKAPFLNVYRLLNEPANWEKWRPDLRRIAEQDSAAIVVQKKPGYFVIKDKNAIIQVHNSAVIFSVNDYTDGNHVGYSYSVAPGKSTNETLVTVGKNIPLLKRIVGFINPLSFADTHIDQLKRFMEIDSLRYGCKIFKTKVPDANLLVIRKTVLRKDKFPEAAKMLSTIKEYIHRNNIKQMQPLIAQFLPAGKDSSQVNVGLFIDREVKSQNEITFVRMPKGGPLYAARFHGLFSKRHLVYDGLHQYFTDHLYQSAILPFEMYLDDKLPASDQDVVNIQVNFTTYF